MLTAASGRRAIRAALTESILRLCHEHGLYSGHIDGIICIAGHRADEASDGDDDANQLVIKVHETLSLAVSTVKRVKRENGVGGGGEEEARGGETTAATAAAVDRFVSSPTSAYHFPRRTPLKSERWSATAAMAMAASGAGGGATECRSCGVAFAGFVPLSEHNEAVHGAFTCAGCHRTFTSRSNLERHARLHTGTRPYACGVCGRAFSRRDHLANHAARHALKCAVCAARFPDRAALAEHVAREHRATLVGVCARCNKGFASEAAFDEHKKSHPVAADGGAGGAGGERCEQCPFVCADRLTLAKHRLAHDGAARCYTCLACAGTFTDPLVYAAHLQTAHAADKDIFECCVCRQLCATLDALHRHELTHLQPDGVGALAPPPGPDPPPLTPMEVAPVEVAPVDEASYQCPLCSLRFETAAELEVHASQLNHYEVLPPACLKLEPPECVENGVEVVQPESPPDTAAGTTYTSEFVVTNTPAYVIEVDRGGEGEEATSVPPPPPLQVKVKAQPWRSMWHRPAAAPGAPVAPTPKPQHRRRKGSPEKSVTAAVAAAAGTVSDDGDTPSPGPSRAVDLPPGPHTCSVCGQMEDTFVRIEAHCVLEHNRSPCVYCGKTFAQKANRDRHLCLHTGDRPYACPNCDERFARGDKLKNHRMRAHNIFYPALVARARDAGSSGSGSGGGGGGAAQRREWTFKEWTPPSLTAPAYWPGGGDASSVVHSTGEWQAADDTPKDDRDETRTDGADDTMTEEPDDAMTTADYTRHDEDGSERQDGVALG